MFQSILRAIVLARLARSLATMDERVASRLVAAVRQNEVEPAELTTIRPAA